MMLSVELIGVGNTYVNNENTHNFAHPNNLENIINGFLVRSPPNDLSIQIKYFFVVLIPIPFPLYSG